MSWLRRHLLLHMTLLLVGLLPQSAAAHVWETHDVEPGDNWCDVVQYVAANGDVVRMAPGDYEGDCLILKSGIADEGEPLAIVGRGDGEVRIIARPGAPVLTVFGNYVRLGKLTLIAAPGQPAVVAHGRSLLVDACIFEGGTVGLDLDRATGGFSLIDNLFEDVATPIVSRCTSNDCDKTRAVLRDNVFRSATPQSRHTAVTIEATAEIIATDNVVEGAWATALDLGCTDGPVSVSQNVILGGRVGIRLNAGAGAATLANNVVVGTDVQAVHLAGDRNGIARVQLVANTLVPTAGAALFGEGPFGRKGNAIASPLDPHAPDDVFCSNPFDCWTQPDTMDFRPLPDGPLVTRAPPAYVVSRDLCGTARRNANAAGAFAAHDATPRRLQPVNKTRSTCFDATFVDSRLDNRPEPPPVELEPPIGHGCGGGTTSATALLLACVAAVRRSRSAKR